MCEDEKRCVPVKVTMINGEILTGRFMVPIPITCNEFLNDNVKEFIRMKDGDRVFCVNKRFIMKCEPL